MVKASVISLPRKSHKKERPKSQSKLVGKIPSHVITEYLRNGDPGILKQNQERLSFHRSSASPLQAFQNISNNHHQRMPSINESASAIKQCTDDFDDSEFLNIITERTSPQKFVERGSIEND